jgi:hypothetical protein
VHPRGTTGRTLDEETTIEGGHPVGESAESCAGGVCLTFAIVFDLHYQEIRLRTLRSAWQYW